MPKYYRRCVIRGWWPILICRKQLIDNRNSLGNKDFKLQFNPQAKFGWRADDNTCDIWTGGWAIGTFSLTHLYYEFTMWRNRWSASNCGFDLAKYHGTKLTFVPHKNLDYLVFIDTKYRDTTVFRKQRLHPALIITHPQTRIIWSYSKKNYKRLPSIWVPRPNH